MIGLNSESSSGPKTPRRTYPVRLPPALTEAHYRRAWHQGVHIYGADAAKSSWREVRYRQGMIALFGGRTAGEAHWIDRDGKLEVQSLRPGNVWFVAPDVSHTCVLHRKSEVVMILLERWRMEQGLGPAYQRVTETGSVARLRPYFSVQPILHDLHFTVVNQSKGLPVGDDGSPGPNQINAAYVFARQLWLFHYYGLRTQIDGENADDVLRFLQAD